LYLIRAVELDILDPDILDDIGLASALTVLELTTPGYCPMEPNERPVVP
jgi:hypothetical protein